MPRLVFFPPPLSFTLPAAPFRRFLSLHAAPRPLLALTAAPLARALFARPHDEPLAGALDLLARLATSEARRALLDAAAALSVSNAELHSLPHAELALHALTARHDGPRWHGVVRRALLAIAELGSDFPFAYEHVAREPRRARPLPEAAADLRPLLAAALSPPCADLDLWHEEDDTGAYHFAVLSADAAALGVSFTPSLDSAPLRHTPLRFDRISVDVPRGRLAVTTHHPHDVHAIKAAASRALFGDTAFFEDRPAFTTRPLELLGTAGIATAQLPTPITRMRVIACTQERIRLGRVRATGSRALALFEEGPGLAVGYLPEVTLRFDLAGDDTPVDVEVRLPSRFWCSAPRWEPVIREALAGLGMLAPGALPDDAWSLFPVRHPDWRLRKALGDAEVESLLASGALARVVSRNVTREELRAQGSNLLTFPIPGEPGASYAISSDPSVPSRDVTARDRELFELDVTKLAAIRAREMNLEGEPRVHDGGARVTLGTLTTRAAALAFVALLRAPASAAEESALAKEIAADVFPAHSVLLVPKGRILAGSLLKVEFEGLLRGGRALVERAVTLARLEDEIDPYRLTDAPLVVHRKTRRIWFHETPMEMADSGYTMLEGLALRSGELSPVRDVCKWLSPAREDLQAAKATRPKVVRWLISSFEAAGKRPPIEEIEQVIEVVGKRGYRLGVAVRVF